MVLTLSGVSGTALIISFLGSNAAAIVPISTSDTSPSSRRMECARCFTRFNSSVSRPSICWESSILWLNPCISQCCYNPLHGLFGISIVFAAANSDKPPAQTLQDCLTFHIFANLILSAMITLTIAFDHNLLSPAYGNHIQAISTDFPLLHQMISPDCKVFGNSSFKWRFCFLFDFSIQHMDRFWIQ